MALGDYERRREAEISEVRELLWAEKQEAAALRERAEQQRKAMEERRADIDGFKVRRGYGSPALDVILEGQGSALCWSGRQGTLNTSLLHLSVLERSGWLPLATERGNFRGSYLR